MESESKPSAPRFASPSFLVYFLSINEFHNMYVCFVCVTLTGALLLFTLRCIAWRFEVMNRLVFMALDFGFPWVWGLSMVQCVGLDWIWFDSKGRIGTPCNIAQA